MCARVRGGRDNFLEKQARLAMMAAERFGENETTCEEGAHTFGKTAESVCGLQLSIMSDLSS